MNSTDQLCNLCSTSPLETPWKGQLHQATQCTCLLFHMQPAIKEQACNVQWIATFIRAPLLVSPTDAPSSNYSKNMQAYIHSFIYVSVHAFMYVCMHVFTKYVCMYVSEHLYNVYGESHRGTILYSHHIIQHPFIFHCCCFFHCWKPDMDIYYIVNYFSSLYLIYIIHYKGKASKY